MSAPGVSPFRQVVAGVTLIHAVVGAVVAVTRPGPLLSRDDVANLALSRWIATGDATVLPEQPPYGFLLPVLSAPAWWLGLDVDGVHTWTRVVNAGLGAATIPVLVFAGRRLAPEVGKWRVLVGAVVAASLPGLWLQSSIAWTERLLPFLVAVAFAGLVAADRGDGRGWLVTTGAAIGLMATHPRGVALAVPIIVGLAWIWRRRVGREAAVLGAAVGLSALVVTEQVRRAIQTAALETSGLYDAVDILERRDLDQVAEMITKGTGAISSVVIGTLGLVVAGGFALWRSSPGRVILGAAAVTLAMAAVFLAGIDTADAWFQDRYLLVVAGPFVLLGVMDPAGWRRQWSTLAVLGGALLAAGVVGWVSGPGDTWALGRTPVMMLGVEPMGAPFGGFRFSPITATLVALVVGGVLFVVQRWSSPLAVLGLAVAIGVGTIGASQTIDLTWRGSIGAGMEAADLPTDGTVAVDVENLPIATAEAMIARLEFERVVSADEPADYLVLADGDAPPVGAELELEIGGVTVWSLGGS